MSVEIKITELEHGKVRYATTVVITGKAGTDELYVGYNDALLRLKVTQEQLTQLRVGDTLYYHDGVLTLDPQGAPAKPAPKPSQPEPVKSHPSKASMAHRFPQR